MKNMVSFSGGKDSTAMLLRMIELNIPIDKIIFADTGLEFPEMYKHIKKIEKHIKRKIIIVKGKNTWDSWFYGTFTRGKQKGRRRGFPYVIQRCWATRELKEKPLKEAQGKNNIIYIGIAYDEKQRIERKTYKEGNFRFPLIEWKWTEQNCIDYLKSKNMLSNIHTEFKRTGCWLCPKQSKKSLKTLFQNYPKLWKKLKEYEKDSPHGFHPKYELNKLEKEFKEVSKNE